MSKTPRKSIVASFGLLSAELEGSQGAQPTASAASPPSSRVGAGVIGAAHRAIDDIRAERDRLKAIVEAGGGAILDLDPGSVDPSPYPDRLPDDTPEEFEAFKRSMEADGQKVPVQVRRHPAIEGRYQVVYGHRRWRAAKELGQPLRAIELEMSDIDLVVAQGIENASRQDLTWIERALFASRMDEAGLKPRTIYGALSIDDAELARMRGVYRTIPGDLIAAIGRAPRIGRPRWVELAKVVAVDVDNLSRLRDVVARAQADGLVSDQRFQKALDELSPSAVRAKTPQPIVSAQGEQIGAWIGSSKDIRITGDGAKGREFLAFIRQELPDLVRRFTKIEDDGRP